MQFVESVCKKAMRVLQPSIDRDLSLEETPWRLSIRADSHPLELLVYFKTHEEAKDGEDHFKSLGWNSYGIQWHLDLETS